MAEMAKYSKAYYLKKCRAFSGWTEMAENARPEKDDEHNEEGESAGPPSPLTDDSVVYIHDNHVVTHGIYKDENILFDRATPEWIAYCRKELAFEIPVFEPVEIKETAGETR